MNKSLCLPQMSCSLLYTLRTLPEVLSESEKASSSHRGEGKQILTERHTGKRGGKRCWGHGETIWILVPPPFQQIKQKPQRWCERAVKGPLVPLQCLHCLGCRLCHPQPHPSPWLSSSTRIADVLCSPSASQLQNSPGCHLLERLNFIW